VLGAGLLLTGLALTFSTAYQTHDGASALIHWPGQTREDPADTTA